MTRSPLETETSETALMMMVWSADGSELKRKERRRTSLELVEVMYTILILILMHYNKHKSSFREIKS